MDSKVNPNDVCVYQRECINVEKKCINVSNVDHNKEKDVYYFAELLVDLILLLNYSFK